MTPLGRAQTSLIVKIKETYLPDDDVGGQHIETNDVDFTGGADAPSGAGGDQSPDAPPVQEDDDFC